VETPAELPFIRDQVVCLSHDQAARSGAESGRLERLGERTGQILQLHLSLAGRIQHGCSPWTLAPLGASLLDLDQGLARESAFLYRRLSGRRVTCPPLVPRR
jgi:hypothetical protein